MSAKGDFPHDAVVEALQRHDGDVDAAYQDLSSSGDGLLEVRSVPHHRKYSRMGILLIRFANYLSANLLIKD